MIHYYDEERKLIGSVPCGLFELNDDRVAEGAIKYWTATYALFLGLNAQQEFHLFKIDRKGGFHVTEVI